jgi:hypothetical protein
MEVHHKLSLLFVCLADEPPPLLLMSCSWPVVGPLGNPTTNTPEQTSDLGYLVNNLIDPKSQINDLDILHG